MRTHSQVVGGVGGAIVLASLFLERSQFVQVTPLPFENYRISVKDEEPVRTALDTLAEAFPPYEEDEA